MSSRKRPLAELAQVRVTPLRQDATTPKSFQHLQPRTATRIRSTQLNEFRPGSARGILHRLARITAPISKRRVVTPSTVTRNKGYISADIEDKEDVDQPKRPRLNFEIEESIEEDDSELLVAPSPSALLNDTDDEEEQPTLAFENADESHLARLRKNKRRSQASLYLQSDSALPDDRDEGEDHYSTFLSERGRRAVSEEATRMSRYSFGSIHMSEFGSELEIRRESDRQQKTAALESEDEYGEAFNYADDVRFGGETENLKNLRPLSPQSLDNGNGSDQNETLAPAVDANESFQLDIPDVSEIDVVAGQTAGALEQPDMADTALEEDNAQHSERDVAPRSDAPEQSRRQTILESVAAAASTSRSRKKFKLNKRGNMIPSLPSSLIKRIVHTSQEKANKRKTVLGKDHMKALEQATEWFFEQVSEDLEAYSSHGRRKKRIDTDDMLLLMKRQRILQQDGELFKLAKNWLPREMLNEMDLPARP